jgi:predicted metalloprotease with PDZ domain
MPLGLFGRNAVRSFARAVFATRIGVVNCKFPIVNCMRPSRPALAVLAALAIVASAGAADPIHYRFTFPAPEHHWVQVDAVFSGLDAAPLDLRMSRSSPGRYSIHDFAKNVYDVRAEGPDGGDLVVTHRDPSGWTVAQHGPSVTVRYKVFGDRVDGTYLAVDSSHAHLNMPAVIMWARGLDDRPSTLTFVPPADTGWRVASQLHPAGSPFEFTAPNLQYLMDSPTELGPGSITQFDVDGHTFRFAAHHTGTAEELDLFVKDVEKIVRTEGAIFGEYPAYEPRSYTFLADYLPYASGDGMEHRNSTVLTSSGSIRMNRGDLLDTVAHEFFHGWNVERIRPTSLEPFDFERGNMSAELWLGEGFTQYYGPLALSRAGLEDLKSTATTMAGLIHSVTYNPGRGVRSAAEMSQMAVFTDGGQTSDRTNWADTYISYYPFGGALALGLDLSLRGRSGGRLSLDDFMRAMWRAHGKPGASREGYVDHPYTMNDAERRLAEVSGDGAFAREFFTRYVRGRDVLDYAALLRPAGLVLRKINPGRAWWGDPRIDSQSGVRITTAPLANTPAYNAGLDLGDEIRQMDGERIASVAQIMAIMRRHKPGDGVSVEFRDRAGRSRTGRVTFIEDPEVELVPVESTGTAINPSQRAFRDAWLGVR